jgi:hypothetical protein
LRLEQECQGGAGNTGANDNNLNQLKSYGQQTFVTGISSGSLTDSLVVSAEPHIADTRTVNGIKTEWGRKNLRRAKLVIRRGSGTGTGTGKSAKTLFPSGEFGP